MARRPRWEIVGTRDGIDTVDLFSWKYFHDFITQEMLPFSHYIWRGQREADWKLESSLDRALIGKPRKGRAALVSGHLEDFKLASRGRRSSAAPIGSDDEWWALGQHNGLATPLLDWSESPFVALYFAFDSDKKPASGMRSVWALGSVHSKNAELDEAHEGAGKPPVLDYVRPLQDDNARLVNQAGLFTRVPLGLTVCDWVAANYKGVSNEDVLIKIRIPEDGRLDCLRTLSKMNINHKSLFPDLYGAAEHSNKRLRIANY